MPTENFSWSPYGNAAFSNDSQDTGDVITGATVTGVGSTYSGTVNYGGPTATPYGGSSWLFLSNGNGTATQSLGLSFGDDLSDATNNGVFDARFVIGDIDAGTGTSGFQDSITISATDTDGDPLTVVATSNAAFSVTNNPDGSVTLTGLPGSSAPPFLA